MNAPRTGREIFRPRRHLLMVAEPLDTPPERLLEEVGCGFPEQKTRPVSSAPGLDPGVYRETAASPPTEFELACDPLRPRDARAEEYRAAARKATG